MHTTHSTHSTHSTRHAHLLPQAAVGKADNRHRGHSRVALQYRLHLAAVHILPPTLDRVLQAAKQPQLAQGIQAAEVARAQPGIRAQHLSDRAAQHSTALSHQSWAWHD